MPIKLSGMVWWEVADRDCDEDIYNAAKLQKIIFNKKRVFFETKLTESIGKPKDLWKALISIGLSNKASSSEIKALKINIQLNTMLTQY